MSQYKSKPIRVAVALMMILREERNTKVFIQQRMAPQEIKGKWEFPGGTVEEGEELEETLVREIQEELGLVITTAQVKLVHAQIVRFSLLPEFLLVFYKIYYEGIKPFVVPLVGSEVMDYKWVDVMDFKAHDTLPGELEALTKAL